MCLFSTSGGRRKDRTGNSSLLNAQGDVTFWGGVGYIPKQSGGFEKQRGMCIYEEGGRDTDPAYLQTESETESETDRQREMQDPNIPY